MPGSGMDAWLAAGEGGRSWGPGEFARLVGIETEADWAAGRRLPSQDASSLSVRVENGCRGPNDSLRTDAMFIYALNQGKSCRREWT